jgi:hypothetical protein
MLEGVSPCYRQEHQLVEDLQIWQPFVECAVRRNIVAYCDIRQAAQSKVRLPF